MYRPIQSLLSTGLVQCQVIPNDRYRKAYEIPDVELKPLVGGMKFRDTKHGDGATVENGDIVNVQFTGRLLGGREVEATTNLSGGVMTITAGGSDPCSVGGGDWDERVWNPRVASTTHDALSCQIPRPNHDIRRDGSDRRPETCTIGIPVE